MKTSGYILIVLLIISVLAVDMHFSATDMEYSMHNPGWAGTSLFISDAIASGAELIKDYEELAGITNSTLIIIEPDGEYTPDELRKIRDYKFNGNKIFISDETGSSEILHRLFGSGLSVTKANLSGIDIEYNNPRFLICHVSAPDPLLSGVESLVLNRPSVATGGDTLAGTSLLSWVDENGNGKADGGESLGKKSVLVISEDVYLLSDSGIFQNSLYKYKNMRDNRRLTENLLQSSENIFIDYSHSGIGSEDGFLEWINLLRQNDIIKATAVIIIILLLLFIYRGKND